MSEVISPALNRKRLHFLLALLGALAVLAAGCGDGSDDGAGDDTTTTASEADVSEADDGGSGAGDETDSGDDSGDGSGEAGSGGDLTGQWNADAADTLAANTANVGMPPGIACSGPMTLTFAGDGTFSAGGTAECAAGGLTITGTMNTTGNWAVTEDGMVEISGATSDGGFDVPGIEIPPVDVVSDGTFAYSIDGDTLSVTFSDPAVGEVTQTWTRT